MTLQLMNVARDGSSDLTTVHRLGSRGIRVVLTPEHDLTEYFYQAQQLDMKIVGVLARESFHDEPREPHLDRYVKQYGSYLWAVQSGNEPDHESPSSWTMTQAEYNDLGKLVRKRSPSYVAVISGGLASGQPDWLDGLDLLWADAVGIHAYLKDAPNPGDLEDLVDIIVLIEQYKQKIGAPIFISEWGWWGAEESRAVEEVGDMISWASATTDIVGFAYFCFSDSMVAPFGLYNADGSQKPRAEAYRRAAQQQVLTSWPNIIPIPPSPRPEPTFDPWQFFNAETLRIATQTPQIYAQNIEFSWPKIVEQMQHAGINDGPTQVGMAATIAIETGRRWLPIKEFRNSDGSIPAYWHNYDGGWTYHGRGYIQNTHRYNYAALQLKIAELWNTSPDQPDFDFVNNPDLLLNPDMSAAAAAVYFRDRDISAMCANRDWAAVRRAVQGNAAPADSIAILTRDAEALWTVANFEPPTPQLSEVEQLQLALRTLRDESIPRLKGSSLESAMENIAEIDRIVRQFVGDE